MRHNTTGKMEGEFIKKMQTNNQTQVKHNVCMAVRLKRSYWGVSYFVESYSAVESRPFPIC